MKIILMKLLTLFFFLSCALAKTLDAKENNQAGLKLRPKLFLYAASMPKPLTNKALAYQRNVIDVLLATQKYEIVFSPIPEFLAPARRPQKVLKYKIRTQEDRIHYKVEFALFDADQVKLEKIAQHQKIKKKDLLFFFRLYLYEFILERKIIDDELKAFQIKSSQRIKKLDSNQKLPKQKSQNIPLLTKLDKIIEEETQKNYKNQSKEKTKIGAQVKRAVNKDKSLWALIFGDEQDISYFEQLKNEKTKKEQNSKQKDLQKKTQNAFYLNSSIHALGLDEMKQSLARVLTLFSWKYVQRDFLIHDIAKLSNSFQSIVGFNLEVNYSLPLYVSPYVFRFALEFDRALETTPVDITTHTLSRFGIGKYWKPRIMPSLFFETSTLNYVNLNEIGKGFELNTHAVYWVSGEIAYLTPQFYASLLIGKSLYSSLNGDTRESARPDGYKVGLNLRYYSRKKIFKQQLWFDFDLRREIFQRQMTDGLMNIDKSEYSFRVGTQFY